MTDLASMGVLAEPSMLDVRAPRLVAGRYVLGEPVGRGGMGRVYRAHDQLLDREVAVKLLYADAVHDGELGRACATEARAAGRLAHDGVARVYDAGVDDGCLFIVMELVRGETLASRLAGGTRLPIREAVALAALVADALEHAPSAAWCTATSSRPISSSRRRGAPSSSTSGSPTPRR